MAIPSGVILIWTGTNATIPSGWSRETALDNKYPKGHGSKNPNTSGGSNTHTHNGGHTHTMNSHTHYVTFGYSGEGAAENNQNPVNLSNHDHSASTSSGSSGGALQSTGTWATASSEPSYYSVIFVKPSGIQSNIASGLCAYFNLTTNPSGWKYCNGSNSTPDLRNKYIKGASAGADAGTTGGGTTHTHDISHSHTSDAHTHTGTTGGATNYGTRNPGGGSSTATPSHTHSYTLNSTQTSQAYNNTTAGGSDTVEPAYKKVGLFKNSGAGGRVGLIGLWLGDVANIPQNWQACDGTNNTLDLRDKFIKVGTSLTENGNTGGSNTHTHSSVSHTHTGNAHTHTGNYTGTANSCNTSGTGSYGVALCSHTHYITTDSVTAGYSTNDMTCASSSNQPAYLTVAYIQLMKAGGGGSFLLNLI